MKDAINTYNKDYEVLISTTLLKRHSLSDGRKEKVSKIYGENFAPQISRTQNAFHMTTSDTPEKFPETNHYIVFQQAMKPLLFWGQCWGLNPVLGIFEKDPYKVKFHKNSFRFWYTAILWLFQTIIAILCFIYMIPDGLTIADLSCLFFYGSTSIITFLSIRTASKWPALVQEISSSGLNANPNIVYKCKVAFFALLIIAIVEHILSIIANITFITDCFPEKEVYRTYIEKSFPFIFGYGVTYHLAFGIFLQCLTLNCSLNWNYSDIFIICISIYLSSVIAELNKKVFLASKDKKLSSASWRNLREAYTRATLLVKSFDGTINGVIFVSFSTSLFFVCLQLNNVLVNGFQTAMDANCPNFPSGPFRGYEHSIYFSFSLMTVLIRAVTVALIAASVHTASIAVASPLYQVPSSLYCEEVQRFIEQVHGDHVALSGYEFFYMTRQLVLSVAGTIVTYELVLLQFSSGENSIKADGHVLSLVSFNTTSPSY